MTTLDKVIEVLSDISLIDEIRPEMTMDDLCLDTIDVVEAEQKLGVTLTPYTTVNDIVKLIKSKGYETL